MVIAEKQNLQTDPVSDRRHERILERMNRFLMAPRSFNRPRPEWNSQSQTLRSMDLVGLERDTVDMAGHPSIFQSLFQSVFDNLSPRPHTSHSEHSRTTPLPLLHTKKESHVKSEPDVHIIPIIYLDKEEDEKDDIKPIATKNQHESKPEPILIADDNEVEDCDIDIDTPEIIECDLSDFTKASNKNNNTKTAEVIECDDIPTAIFDNESDCSITRVIDKHYDINTTDAIKGNNSTPPISSLVRKSLPIVSQRSKVNVTNSSKNIILIDDYNVVKDCGNQSMRNVRSNKDTLVGGANKVLADNVVPDGYYTGEVPPGAAYLSGHGSTSQDVQSLLDEEKPVNEVPDHPVYTFLKKKLLKECRQIDYIKGDGNCFFRALSKQLYGSERYHIVLRNLIVDIIATNKNKFCQFVDGGDVQDHVERMSQEQSWATTCEIYAAATLLQRDIFMLTPDHLNQTYSWLLFKPVFKMDAQHANIESHPCYITLCNTNGNHYDRIAAEHGGCNCFLTHPELDGVSYSVDLTS